MSYPPETELFAPERLDQTFRGEHSHGITRTREQNHHRHGRVGIACLQSIFLSTAAQERISEAGILQPILRLRRGEFNVL